MTGITMGDGESVPARNARLAGSWFHLDGSRCPIFLAHSPIPESAAEYWWCTEHQQSVEWDPAGIVGEDSWEMSWREWAAPHIRTLMAKLMGGPDGWPTDAEAEAAFRRLYDALPALEVAT